MSLSLGKKHRILFWVLFLSTLVLDQVIKSHVRSIFVPGQSVAIIPNVLDYTLQFNKGIAFGMLQGMGVFLAPVAIMIAVLATVYSHRHPREHSWTHAAMALLASGAIGNLYDRLVHQQVTDMFWIRVFEFPVFNIADSCITVAAAILIFKWGKEAFVPSESQEEAVSTGAEIPEPAHENAETSLVGEGEVISTHVEENAAEPETDKPTSSSS